MDAGIKIAYGVNTKKHICSIIKHNTPCGASIGRTQTECYYKALEGDPVSAFGGIVCFNKSITKKIAKLLVKSFYEVIAAPSFEKGTIEIFQTKKNLRVIKVKKINQKIEKRNFFGGTLIQDVDRKQTSIENINGINKIIMIKIWAGRDSNNNPAIIR